MSDSYTGSQARRLNTENTTEVGNYILVNGKLSYLFDVTGLGMNAEVFVAGEFFYFCYG